MLKEVFLSSGIRLRTASERGNPLALFTVYFRNEDERARAEALADEWGLALSGDRPTLILLTEAFIGKIPQAEIKCLVPAHLLRMSACLPEAPDPCNLPLLARGIRLGEAPHTRDEENAYLSDVQGALASAKRLHSGGSVLRACALLSAIYDLTFHI